MRNVRREEDLGSDFEDGAIFPSFRHIEAIERERERETLLLHVCLNAWILAMVNCVCVLNSECVRTDPKIQVKQKSKYCEDRDEHREGEREREREQGLMFRS